MIEYLPVEIRSVLPSGWSVAPGVGAFDARRQSYATRVMDSTDTDWELVVKRRDAERLGRIEALRQAMDKLYREALG